MLFKTASSSSVQLGADDWPTTDYSTPLEASAICVGRPNTRVVEAKLGTLDVLIYCDSNELNLSPKKGAIAVTLYKNAWHEVVREKRGEDKHKQCYIVRKVLEAHEYDLVDYEGRSLPRWEAQYEEARAQKALAQAAEEHAQLAIQTAAQSDDDEPIRSPQITKQSSGSSASIAAVDPLDKQIRNSPIQSPGRVSSPIVTFKPQLLMATTMSTTTTTQTATTTAAAPATSGTVATPESIQQSL